MSDKVKQIPLEDITVDARLQMRAEGLDPNIIEEYAENLDKLPPSIVYSDSDGRIWLTEGFHRYDAHKLKKRKTMPCIIRTGEFIEAKLAAIGANYHHGARRSNATKRNAVLALLSEDEWAARSIRWLADQAHVSEELVKAIRSEKTPTRKSQVDAPQEEGQPTEKPADVPIVKKSPEYRQGKDGKMHPADPKNAPIICSRCKRSGKQIADCPACRELNKPPEAIEPKPAATKDPCGIEIPATLLDVFSDPWLSKLIEAADIALERLKPDPASRQLAAKQKMYMKWMNVGNAMAQIKIAYNAIIDYRETLEGGRPFAVCKQCGGRRCKACREAGWIPVNRYEELELEGAES